MNYKPYLDRIKAAVGSNAYVGCSLVTVGDKLAVYVEGELTAIMLRIVADALDEAQKAQEVTKS